MRSPETFDRKPVGDGRMPVPVASGCPTRLGGKPPQRTETGR